MLVNDDILSNTVTKRSKAAANVDKEAVSSAPLPSGAAGSSLGRFVIIWGTRGVDQNLKFDSSVRL
jgi:hypothetical protein